MILSDEAKGIILEQTRRIYPNECCGALLGADIEAGERVIALALPIENTFADGEQYHRFQITADDILKAEETARKRGLDVLGFYHSHPDHPAVPSAYDRAQALPFYSYLIISVEQGKPRELLAWRLKTDRSAFEKEEFSLSNP